MLKYNLETKFYFKPKLWKYEGPAGWCFVNIPKLTAKRIRSLYSSSEEGWGRLKTTATIGTSSWKTSVWYDSKAGPYLLPIKMAVRRKEKLAIGAFVIGQIEFEVDRWMRSQL